MKFSVAESSQQLYSRWGSKGNTLMKMKFEGFFFSKLQLNFMAVSRYYLCCSRHLYFLNHLTSLPIKKPIQLGVSLSDKFSSCCSCTTKNVKQWLHSVLTVEVLALPVLMRKLETQHKKWEPFGNATTPHSFCSLPNILTQSQIYNREIPAVEVLQMATPILCHFGLSPQRIIPHGFFYRVGISFLGEMDIWAWKIAVGTNNGEIAFINWNKVFQFVETAGGRNESYE